MLLYALLGAAAPLLYIEPTQREATLVTGKATPPRTLSGPPSSSVRWSKGLGGSSKASHSRSSMDRICCRRGCLRMRPSSSAASGITCQPCFPIYLHRNLNIERICCRRGCLRMRPCSSAGSSTARKPLHAFMSSAESPLCIALPRVSAGNSEHWQGLPQAGMTRVSAGNSEHWQGLPQAGMRCKSFHPTSHSCKA